MDLALNNLQRLICHKTKPNQTKSVILAQMVEAEEYADRISAQTPPPTSVLAIT